VAGDKLLVSLQYPVTTQSLLVLDKHNLILSTTIEMSGEAAGIAIDGDSAYVAVPGAWGTPEGKMAVIDLTTETLSREINLGSEARGIKALFLRDDNIYTVNTHFSDYEANTFSVSVFDIAADSYETTVLSGDYYGYYGNTVMSENILYIPVSSSIATYNVNNGENTMDFLEITPAAVGYDKADDRLHITTSDYATYGSYQVYNLNGDPLSNTIPVGVSPEAIALDYDISTALPTVSRSHGKAYFSGNRLVVKSRQGIRKVSVFNATGQLLRSERFSPAKKVQLRAGTSQNGLLLLRVETQEGSFTSKVVR
jgi:hypothetical protein